MRYLILLVVMMLSMWVDVSAQQPSDTLSQQHVTATADYQKSQRYVIGDVKVKGVKFFDANVIRSNVGFTRGDSITIPSSRISNAINKLWSMRYFSDVQIIAHPQGGNVVDIDIVLQERPRVYRWEYVGARKGETSDLKEKLQDLKRGVELSEHLINNCENIIRNFYVDKGFRNVEVSTVISNDNVIQNAVNIKFVIDRKTKVRVGEIVFDGNEAFPDKRLARTFKKIHKVSPLFFQNNKFKEKEFEEDKENLLDFYNSKGYRNAAILADSLYPIPDKENRIGLYVKVHEGNQYYFRNITWVGNSVYDTRDLKTLLGVKSGDLYDRKTLYKRLGYGKEDNIDDESTINSLYQNNGYLMAKIDPSETIVGEDSIDLEIKIFEGEPFTINNVEISGNNRVNDEVIRRELVTQPGDLYNRSLLMETVYRLNSMGHFNAESIQPVPQPITDKSVDIAWPLEEQASDKVDISGGWGAGMFVGSIGVQLNNLSLRKFFKKDAWRPYPQGQNQQLRIQGQSNGTYYKAISMSFTEPWLGGKRPNSLSISAYYSDETDAYYAWQEGNAHFRTFGVSAGIGQRLRWPDPYFSLYTELSYQRYMLKDWTSFIVSNGSSNIISFRAILGRSSVNQTIYPRTGSDFSLSVAVTPPYSLFDKRDYSDKSMSNNLRYGWIEYHKWQFKGKLFTPLDPANKLVLMARLEFGYLGSYNKNKLSPFEGFTIGGDGLTGYSVYGVDVIGLRGYTDGALVPAESTAKNDYARGYTKYTLELRYPFLLQPRSTIYGLVFAEAGNGYSSWKNFDPFNVKRSLGVGVRVYLPIVGMLGVDWGWGFDAPAGATKRSGSQFHFTIGTEF